MTAPTALTQLGASEVHVWRIPLDGAPDGLDLLDHAERARAARFVFARDRQRYVIAHAAVRRILAPYVAAAPADLRFREGAHGKPSLDGDTPIQFNLAHAHELALLAVGRTRALGVDLEHQRPIELELLATRFFSAGERDAILTLPAAARPDAFFRTWARRESYMKALGLGLNLPLDAPYDPRCWITDLAIDAGYRAALTVDGGAAQVHVLDLASSIRR